VRPVRLAVAGAGFMARRRARAFLATGRVEVCGVAARRLASARELAAEIGGASREEVRDLRSLDPEALLVEVPHAAQDEIVTWALREGLHVLVGGPLSASLAGGEEIRRLSEERGLIVEAGYEARYKAVWETARERIANGELGRLVAVRAVGLWPGKPESWYYDQSLSGGMPLTHMTYVFLNPLRWLLGDPTHVAAFANRKLHTGPGQVTEETCAAVLRFPDDVLCTLLAGYVDPGDRDPWSVSILGTEGSLAIHPTEMENGSWALARDGRETTLDCADTPDAFEAQAHAFLDSLRGPSRCRNRPADCLGDLRLAEAISRAAREKRTIELAIPPTTSPTTAPAPAPDPAAPPGSVAADRPSAGGASPARSSE
jgi:myo-inositol 2-dehydrogenase / D-chiro-inositol 1-dehydrogenase